MCVYIYIYTACWCSYNYELIIACLVSWVTTPPKKTKVMLAAVEYQSDSDVSTTFSPNCRQPPKVIEDPHAPLPPPMCGK